MSTKKKILIALFALSGVVVAETKKYFDKQKG